MEVLLELLLEFLIQVFGELLFEVGLRSLAEPFRRPPNPLLAAVGYAIFGSIFGGISLLVLSHRMVSGQVWRWANLLVVPFAVGLCMSLLGRWRVKQGQEVFPIDRFTYGYMFAFFFALLRFLGASDA